MPIPDTLLNRNQFSAAKKRISQRAIFIVYMSLFTMSIILAFASLLRLDLSEGDIIGLLAVTTLFDLFIVETLVLFIVGTWLLKSNILAKVFLYLLSSLFIATYLAQFASFYTGGELISRLAVDNVNHIGLLINSKTIKGIIFLFSICLALPILVELKAEQRRKEPVKRSSIILIIAAIVTLSQSNKWLPDSIIQQRDDFLQDNYLLHTAPFSALIKTLFFTQAGLPDRSSKDYFDQVELREIYRSGFYFDAGEEYPLVKDRIYSSPAPFKKHAESITQPNVIVFFTEGFSARALSSYGAQYKNLTPNLNAFAKTSMVVENYYNHTQATYRGIHGQLCSLFPTYGGVGGWHTNYKDLPATTYLCLSNLFNQENYHTIFLDAHRKHHSQVDEMVQQLGFKRVIDGEELAEKYLEGAKSHGRYAYSDKQFFQGIIGFLKEHEGNNTNSPFFMGLYNLGTHAFKKSFGDGRKYGEGNNTSLNFIHNFDYAFGLFWRYFKTSGYADNTIIVFTTDHCHYPEKPFVEAFAGQGYQGFMIDKIPLIIHDPTRKLPARFDAHQSTSIDFAPSLIHYLGLENRKNPFMGTSIFEKDFNKVQNLGFGSFGNNLFLVDGEKISRFGFSDEYNRKFKILHKYIEYTKHLEVTDKLWNAEQKGKDVLPGDG